MITRIIKSPKEYTTFQQEQNTHFYRNPDEYPCIAFVGFENADVRWSKDGFKISYESNILFLYPNKIQKELYEEEFDDLVKK